MQQAELHLHDVYSVMDGTSSPEDYMARAAELGITHLAETNHGTLAGHRHFQRAAKAAGITPILGVEHYFTNDRFDRTAAAKRNQGDSIYNHITILAQNETGLTNLRKIDEVAWVEGFYSKPRLDLDVLEQHNEGLIVLSGCLSGVLSKAIENGLHTYADQMASEFKRIFGERYFIELMSHNPLEINKGLVDIANKFGFKYVVTSDCHHARKEDLWVQEAMLILSTSPTKAKSIDFSKSQKMDWLERFNYLYPNRAMSFQEFNLHLNSVEEHLAGLEKHGIGQEAIDNTMIVAGMIDAESYPYYEGLDLLPKTQENVDDLLEKKVFAGLRKKGLDKDERYVERAHHELEIIKNKGFSPYFHIAEKAISWAKQQGIRVGPGRGSGAGSLVCYSMDLTKVDPIKYNLVFARFIDPSRPDWPDLDTDFEDKRREEVKAYMRRQYKNVASIATFGYFKDKGVIRDAARVLSVPLGDVNRALKRVDSWEAFQNSETTADFRAKYPEVEQLAARLRGNIRSTGMHAGGLVVSNRPLSDIAPVQTASIPNDKSGNRVAVVAYDMNEIAEVGLIKYDFLGLKALSVLNDAVRLIKERHGEEIDLDALSLDDQKVFQMLSEGYTRGVFQCEAVPYTNLLIDMGGVKNFDELVASNALVRPGAANSSFGEKYVTAKNGGPYEYIHPDTQWFTKDTWGSILYQEQQMFLCTDLAGMSMVEANKVRKAIGKKKADELAKWKDVFIDGASNKIPRDIAEDLWHDLEAAADYSFNLSHAVAYSMISYQTAWLKVHYPIEFMAANLMNEEDKDSRLEYLMEARRLGIRVLIPHVNKSDVQVSIQKIGNEDALRLGLSDIKYISEKLATRLIEMRPFESYAQLSDIVMTKGSGLNTRVLQSLNAIGGAVFDDNPLRGNERDNFYEYLNIPAFQTKELSPVVKSQLRTLDEYSENETFVCYGMVRGIKRGTGWARIDMVDETGTAGVFAPENTLIEKGNIYVFLVSNNSILRYVSMEDLGNDKGGDFQEFIEATGFPDVPDGMLRVVAMLPRTTKAGKKMATVVFSDAHKELTSALVFPSQFMKAYAYCREGKVVDVVLKETQDGTLFLDNVL